MKDNLIKTDLQIKSLQPSKKDAWYSLTNGKGLRLLVKANGQK
jgi:hypothetical protein